MKRIVSVLFLAAVIVGVSAPQAGASPRFAPTVVSRAELTGEPGVAVDRRGRTPTIYVVAPDTSTLLWRSTNGGLSFQRMAATGGAGGDSTVTVDAKGTLYVTDLNDMGNGKIPVSVSTNGGRSYRRKTDAGSAGISYDRQWAASNGAARLVVTAHDTTNRKLVSRVTRDQARTFDDGNDITTDVTVPGPLVAGPRGIYYTAYGSSAGISFAKSRNGVDWSTGVVSSGHAPVLFPVIAVDDASNLYVAWSDASEVIGFGTTPIYVSRSSNGGRTWSQPQAVSSVKPDLYGMTPSAVFPWVVAGKKGRVDLSYVIARTVLAPDFASDFGGPQTTWDVMVAQSTNAASAHPRWSQTVAVRDFHTGSICTFGTLCVGEFGLLNAPIPFDRRDLDFYGMDIDRSGRAYVALTHDRPLTSGNSNDVLLSQTDIMLARQTGGTAIR